MSQDYAEVFSAEIPIPQNKRGKIPPPETITKPKRKYVRKMKDNDPAKPDLAVKPSIIAESDEAMYAAEALFDSDQLCGYYTIKAFIELFNMVKPEDRKKLAQILEGLVVK